MAVKKVAIYGVPEADTTSGIDDVEASDGSDEASAGSQSNMSGNQWYNINGQLVSRAPIALQELPKGIYITNGKKTLVK